MTEQANVDELINRLVASPVDLAAARTAPAAGGIPAEPGLYAWWTVEQDALPGVPAQQVPGRSEWLLYVGIAPKDDVSRQRLRSRACGNHMTGNIGGSTFRLSLASLLWRKEGWRPLWRGDRAQLSRADNHALSEWQRRHLRISWVIQPEPWRYERGLIDRLTPPMNLAENAGHRFHSRMSAARAELRAEARRNSDSAPGAAPPT